MAGATIRTKLRTEIFMMLLRELEALKMREDLAEEVVDLTDWPRVKQRFEAIFEPTMNSIVRDATTLLDMRKQPTEDTSSFALRSRESLLLLPTTAAAPTQLKETVVFPKGSTLCEAPIDGGQLMALSPTSDCHKSMAHPIDNVAIRLLVRRHRTHRGEPTVKVITVDLVRRL